ncbi:MAG TPA: YtxH domain-containing protein [Ktedonobacterales bacterium]|nr:YtxH domain-containing protein [Ktedonobacterales bacterium]
MASKQSKGGSGFVWGMLLGVATGLALALLFAPQPGDVTREQLAEQTSQARKLGRERYTELSGQLRERYGDAWVQAREAFQKAQDQILNQYTSTKNGRE